MGQSESGGKSERAVLIDRALGLYVREMEHEASRRSWIRQPNNFISVVAIVISLLSVIYGLIKDHNDGIDKDLQSLSSTVADLARLDSEMLTSTLTDQDRLGNLQLALNNRRIALLAEADRLIESLGDRVPRSQLAVLGPAYVEVDEYDKAIKYFLLTTQPPSSATLRAEAWRSLALIYMIEGPEFNENVRDAFGKAAAIFPDPQDIGSINIDIMVFEQWGQFEARVPNFPVALDRLTDARRLAERLPCPELRVQNAVRLNTEIRQVLGAFQRIDPPRGAEAASKIPGELLQENVCGT